MPTKTKWILSARRWSRRRVTTSFSCSFNRMLYRVELPVFRDELVTRRDWKGSRRRVSRVSQRERMHFSRSSEVLYFHTDVVSVHTDSHTDLKRHVVASWAIYTEYKASRQAESRMYRCRYARRSPIAKGKIVFSVNSK